MPPKVTFQSITSSLRFPYINHPRIRNLVQSRPFILAQQIFPGLSDLLGDDDQDAQERNLYAHQILRKWTKPCLLMFGEHDEIALDYMDNFLMWIPTKARQFAKNGVVVDNAGHYITEDRPEFVSEVLTQFVAQVH
ncbi:hypothetical protein HK104_009050 [Borealophlyctis nickersoniae]|nr:hypothetical protein HK104_009050 [Borealophlyctis nickersoniae]